MNLWKGGISFRNNDLKVLFFLAFFVAMYVEVKAENTIYQVCKKKLESGFLHRIFKRCQRNSAILNTRVLEQKIKSKIFFIRPSNSATWKSKVEKSEEKMEIKHFQLICKFSWKKWKNWRENKFKIWRENKLNISSWSASSSTWTTSGQLRSTTEEGIQQNRWIMFLFYVFGK